MRKRKIWKRERGIESTEEGTEAPIAMRAPRGPIKCRRPRPIVRQSPSVVISLLGWHSKD